MFKRLLRTKSLCLAAIIAALYAALTLLLAPMSFGAIQFRVSEAMTLLPLIMPEAIPGLFIGCLLANLYTGNVLDIIFGSLATLIAAIITYALRKKPMLASLAPIVVNGVIVGTVLSVSFKLPLFLTMGEIALGEGCAVVVGYFLMYLLRKVDIEKYLK